MNADVAQLVSVAIYSPVPEETVGFFYDLLGMEISHREGQSVYLRAYEDFYQYTLKVTEAPQAGLDEITWRAASKEALDKISCFNAGESTISSKRPVRPS
jgi:catechol 2,3-dioxygenase